MHTTYSVWDGKPRLNYALPVLHEDVKTIIKAFLMEPLLSDALKAELPDTGWHTEVEISPDSRRVAIGWLDKVKIWDIKTYRLLSTIPMYSYDEPLSALTFGHDSSYILTSGEDPYVDYWDVDTSQCIKRVRTEASFPIGWILEDTERHGILFGEGEKKVALLPNGKMVIGGYQCIKINDIKTSKSIYSWQHPPYPLASVAALSVSYDSNEISYAGNDRVIITCDAANGTFLRENSIDGVSQTIIPIRAISKDKKNVVAGLPWEQLAIFPLGPEGIAAVTGRVSLTGLVLMNQIARSTKRREGFQLTAVTQSIFDSLPEKVQNILITNRRIVMYDECCSVS